MHSPSHMLRDSHTPDDYSDVANPAVADISLTRVAVTIANWNGLEMLKGSLESLSTQTLLPAVVVVTDNGSKDGSVEWLQKHSFSFPLDTIALTENTGFALPHNIAIEQVLEDTSITHILTLNNDARLQPRFIEELVACMERHPEAGSVQGKIYAGEEALGEIDCVGVLIHRDMSGYNRGQKQQDHGQFGLEEEIMGPSASAALYKRHALEAVALPSTRSVKLLDGGSMLLNRDFFDADYFAYYEDVDLLWRLRLAGFTSWFTPLAIAVHAQSATGVTASPFKAFHIHRNHFFNMIKNMPLPFLLWAILLLPLRYFMLVGSVIRGSGAAARLSENVKAGVDSKVAQNTSNPGGPLNMVGIVLRAWLQTAIALPSLLRKRSLIQGQRTVSLREVNRWFRKYAVRWKNIFFE